MAGDKSTVKVTYLGDATALAAASKKAQRSIDGVGKNSAANAKRVTLAFAAGAAAVGVAAFQIGKKFDAAYDTIRVGTGAVGEDLKGLEQSFKTVVKSVPTDFASASTAIADLNTRTGQTGKGLEKLAKQELELARLTKSDLGGTIAGTTRLFGDWGVKTKNQAATLDKLFRASQATGIGVDKLAASTVQFGAPLRAMGFGLDQTVALLGKFEKEGVNGELVMGAFRKGLAKFAKAGEDAPKALARLTREIKVAKSPTEGTALAMEIFGTKAGPDMAAAIREGRFELGSLLDNVSNGKESILGAARDTESFSEKWTKLKNTALVGIEPMVSKIFDAMSSGLDYVTPAFRSMRDLVQSNRTSFKILAAVVTALVAAFVIYSTTVTVVTTVTRAWAAAQAILNGTLALNPIGIVVVALAALATGLVIAYRQSETFRAIVDGAFKGIGIAAQFMWDHWLRPVLKLWANTWLGVVGILVNGAAMAFGWVKGIGPKLKAAAKAFNKFRDDVNDALDGIKDRNVVVRATLTKTGGFQQVHRDEDFAGARAHGGPVSGGKTYLVGENGPELFTADRSGSIIPNGGSASGRGRGGDIYVTLSVGGSVISERDLVRTVRDGLADIIRNRGGDPAVIGA